MYIRARHNIINTDRVKVIDISNHNSSEVVADGESLGEFPSPNDARACMDWIFSNIKEGATTCSISEFWKEYQQKSH